jgi:hypothetical protein
VAKGCSGTYDGSALPWTKRLDMVLQRCLDSMQKGDCPIVAVIDAPPSTEVIEAIAALKLRGDEIGAQYGTNALLMLSGSATLNLPYINDENDFIYDESQWKFMKSIFTPFVETTQHGMSRLEIPLAVFIGRHVAATGVRTAQIDYPDGMTMPSSMIPHATYSNNVRDPRVSRTGGISLHVIDGEDVTVTAILESEDKDDEEDEDPAMAALRQSTGEDTDEVGAAYFALLRITSGPLATIAARAARAVHRKWITVPPPPLPRAQSYFPNAPNAWA